MISNINGGSAANKQADTDFLTAAAAKLGIDGGTVSASFTDKSESFTLKGDVKDKFDFDGNHDASVNLDISTSYGESSTLFASANGKSKNGEGTRTYTAGVKYASSDTAAGTSRTGQLVIINKNGDTSYQVKGGLNDKLTENATLKANVQFDIADGQVDVKQSGQLDLSFDDSFIDSATIGEFMDTKKGSGVTGSVDKKISDNLSSSAGAGVYDNGSKIVSGGLAYSVSEDTSLYANISSFDQDGAGTSNGAQLGVKTKVSDDLSLNVGGFTGDYVEFKDTAAPKQQDEGVFANLEYNF